MENVLLEQDLYVRVIPQSRNRTNISLLREIFGKFRCPKIKCTRIRLNKYLRPTEPCEPFLKYYWDVHIRKGSTVSYNFNVHTGMSTITVLSSPEHERYMLGMSFEGGILNKDALGPAEIGKELKHD